MFFFAELEQLGPQQRTTRQVKGHGSLLLHQASRLCLSLGARQARQVGHRQGYFELGRALLHRHPAHSSERRAQYLVPPDDLMQAGRKGSLVQDAAELHGDRNVV